MTVMDEAPTRNGSVVHSQRTASPDAAITPAASPTATPSAPSAESRPGRRRRGRQTRQEDDFVDAEAAAAAKRAEHFFRGWLIVATGISIVANVAHAWLKAPDEIRVLAAIAALVAPVILLVQRHIVPKLVLVWGWCPGCPGRWGVADISLLLLWLRKTWLPLRAGRSGR